MDSPESFILPFFTRKVLSKGGYTLSRSQNDKTSNIWFIVSAPVSATTTIALKLLEEWRRLPRFPAKMTLAHARALQQKPAYKNLGFSKLV